MFALLIKIKTRILVVPVFFKRVDVLNPLCLVGMAKDRCPTFYKVGSRSC